MGAVTKKLQCGSIDSKFSRNLGNKRSMGKLLQRANRDLYANHELLRRSYSVPWYGTSEQLKKKEDTISCSSKKQKKSLLIA